MATWLLSLTSISEMRISLLNSSSCRTVDHSDCATSDSEWRLLTKIITKCWSSLKTNPVPEMLVFSSGPRPGQFSRTSPSRVWCPISISNSLIVAESQRPSSSCRYNSINKNLNYATSTQSKGNFPRKPHLVNQPVSDRHTLYIAVSQPTSPIFGGQVDFGSSPKKGCPRN